jgi:sec-independent protein translocase protein TatA
MGAMSPTHWLIVIGALVLLFGAKRLPDAARSLGRSARILKAEVREAGADQAASTDEAAATPAPLPPVALDAADTNLAAGQKPPHPAATTSTAD